MPNIPDPTSGQICLSAASEGFPHLTNYVFADRVDYLTPYSWSIAHAVVNQSKNPLIYKFGMSVKDVNVSESRAARMEGGKNIDNDSVKWSQSNTQPILMKLVKHFLCDKCIWAA